MGLKKHSMLLAVGSDMHIDFVEFFSFEVFSSLHFFNYLCELLVVIPHRAGFFQSSKEFYI
jgi:hypothetical protein